MRDRTRTRQRWRQRLEAQQASGLSIPEFCSREGIHKASFYRWRHRLASVAGAGFVEVQVAPAASSGAVVTPAAGIPPDVAVAAKSDRRTPCPAIEVRLANGRTLLVPADFDREHLVKLIAVVEALA
jgi:putative transposase